MVNYWAISIGINQYQLFQPLNCAQADAEALQAFLVKEAGFAPQNCILMTNTSPPIGSRFSDPTKENILLLLEYLAATSWQPQDYLWFFFSGYGVNYQEKDYLMPVEANPELVPETGIELRSLMQSLQVAGLNVLLILDINRAFGTQADAPVGQETIELGQELQLATILSCQPEQFSHESSELGHGFFTAALLEALRSGNGKSLKDLESYLTSLTPKLCQHYWRPIQNPVVVIPSLQQVILPPAQENSNSEVDSEVDPIIYPDETFAIARTAPGLGETALRTSTTEQAWWAKNRMVETTLSPTTPGTQNSQVKEVIPELTTSTAAKLQKDNSQMLATSPELKAANRFIPSASKAYASQKSLSRTNSPVWKQFLLWGGGSMLVAGLITTVILRNQASFRIKKFLTIPPNTANSDPQVLQTSPQTQPPGQLKNSSSAQIVSTPESNKRYQAMRELAKLSLRKDQASDLSLAIASARSIKPGEALYEQAQDNIKVWSQMILDLAESRARQRQYGKAIAAAQLITPEEPIYPQAQAALSQWRIESQLYVSNRTLLDAANALIKPGQASTYNRAIEVAKKVPLGQPGYDIAQKSINKWSEKILDLAKNRAVQGELNAAIETATLVPEVTAAYEDAQDAIQKWRLIKMRK